MQGRVVRITETGGPEVMKVESVEVGDPGEGEVLVKQTAAGLNYLDCYMRSGLVPLPMPISLGQEGAGVVETVGAGVSSVAAGDRVAYAGGPPGAYADIRILPAALLVKTPDAITDEQAAALMLKGMTAEYLLNRTYKVQPGQFVLFYAAAGGVGLIAGQWGKAIGARMIGIAGGPEKCALAKDHGYEFAIDRRSEDVVARVKEITGGAGVPVAYDSVGKETYEQTLDCLAPLGTFASFGSTTGGIASVKPVDLQMKGSLFFTRPTLMTYNAKREDLEASAAAAFDMVEKGAVKVEINQRYALDDIVQAHKDLEAGKTTGSSVITV
ncbi:MAG: quinone oxidoreductase [Alphaproteobacteria bacterium]|nr:quinone oxidoreductase [Alphaproteobacteria bacterium]